ncbi:MAG: hypothetical protein CMQ34_11590 [Gammaproteobacteria bacterium]|nr:hypothetical protein [Gammaproteobacteria bacterium]|tara:strand:- start:89 stop:331 length:243 start_codon:yes stop_codon:yes gene_type:complete
MYPVVTQITVADDYKLQLCFDNGEYGELDMSPYLDFGVFSRLKNKANFQEARVSFDTIEWPCGVDLDPEFVYLKAVKVHS